jgi:molybdopterin-guanine dinucleotide biosynthesis protein A
VCQLGLTGLRPIPVERLVIAAFDLPFLDLFLGDTLAANVQTGHVVGRIDREEQEEGEQVHPDQHQQAIAEAPQYMANH